MAASANSITVHGRPYLLACVGGGAAHLVAEATPDRPRRAVAADDDHRRLNDAYDPDELVEARWCERTLCGRDEWFMAPTEIGPATLTPWLAGEEPVVAPTCRHCLRILDRQFVAPEAHERLAWTVIRCVEELGQWGCVMVDDVPGDQMDLLRVRVRAECRSRGWRIQSTASDGRILATSGNSLSPDQRAVVEQDGPPGTTFLAARLVKPIAISPGLSPHVTGGAARNLKRAGVGRSGAHLVHIRVVKGG